jgi:hypothetical protein
MDEKTRIKKDIEMYKENRANLCGKIEDTDNKLVELADQYYKDAKYYLKINDNFTAFGCINYAHGLLDAITKF